MDHLFLPHCWVCEARFVTSVPPGPETEERHHIIPRQAGGTDGPQVSLCPTHHKKLHNIALRLKSKKPYFDMLNGEDDTRKKKLLWLAAKVFEAFERVKDDPNKLTMVVLTFDRRQSLMVDRLKKTYPSLKSREAIINLALENLYRKHFLE